MKVRNLWRNRFLLPCEGDASGGAGDDKSGAGGAAGGGDSKNGAAGGEDKKFTQADLNRFLAQEKEKTRQQNAALITQLEELRGSKALSEQEKTDLNARIEELQNQSLTKEELAKKALAQKEAEYTGKLTKAEQEGKTWRSRFESQLMETAIVSEAGKAKAFNTTQIDALLRPHSKVVEVIGEDNKPTGKFEVRVDFTHKDDKGKIVTLNVTVPEAVKLMKEQDEYANLFIDEGTGGVGGSANRDNAKGRNKSAEQLAGMSMEQYLEHRKKNPNIL